MEISGRPLSLPVLGTSANLARVVAAHGRRVRCRRILDGLARRAARPARRVRAARHSRAHRASTLRARSVASPGDARGRAPSARAAADEPAQHPVRGQVRDRSPRGARPPRASCRRSCSRSPSPSRLAGPADPLPAGPRQPRRPAVQHAQVPHHGARVRGRGAARRRFDPEVAPGGVEGEDRRTPRRHFPSASGRSTSCRSSSTSSGAR